MSVRNMIVAAALLAAPFLAPSTATALPVDGEYVTLSGGLSFITNTKVQFGSTASGHLATDGAGSAFQGSFGYGLGNGIRIELEVLGNIDDVKVSFSGLSGKANSITTGLMANVLYDIDLGLPVIPYVGLGAGYVGVQERSFRVTNGSGTYNGRDGTLGSTAVQGIVGVSLPVTNAFAATLDYRLLDKIQSRNVGGVYTSGTNVSGLGANVGSSYEQSVMVGFRYALNAAPSMAAPAAPAPVVMAAPAPMPAKSYIVFFDWDSAVLTARAQQIIADAATNAGVIKASRIDVAGHADKSGTAAYNQALSLKRANVVAAELQRLGIAKSAISITAFGDTKPLVPTAAGVREPQNRRVEIVLH